MDRITQSSRLALDNWLAHPGLKTAPAATDRHNRIKGVGRPDRENKIEFVGMTGVHLLEWNKASPAKSPENNGADGGTRTRTMLPSQDFKSCVSTGSTTSATCALCDVRRCDAMACAPYHQHSTDVVI
jgi:hypothetical protein